MGCECRTVEDWDENLEAIAKAANYTDEEAEEYRDHFEACKRSLARKKKQGDMKCK